MNVRLFVRHRELGPTEREQLVACFKDIVGRDAYRLRDVIVRLEQVKKQRGNRGWRCHADCMARGLGLIHAGARGPDCRYVIRTTARRLIRVCLATIQRRIMSRRKNRAALAGEMMRGPRFGT